MKDPFWDDEWKIVSYVNDEGWQISSCPGLRMKDCFSVQDEGWKIVFFLGSKIFLLLRMTDETFFLLFRMKDELGGGRSCHSRLLYLKMCEMAVMLFSRNYFKTNFFNNFLALYQVPKNTFCVFVFRKFSRQTFSSTFSHSTRCLRTLFEVRILFFFSLLLKTNFFINFFALKHFFKLIFFWLL